MKQSKMVATTLVTTMVATSVVSCGSSTNISDGDSEENTVLTVLSPGTAEDDFGETFVEIADEFSANNEYGVTVEFEFYETEQYKTKLTTLMAANSAPDIFLTYEFGYLTPFIEAGKVYNLTEALDADPEWKSSFIEGTLDPLTYDDQIYGIPTQTTLATMYYNKQIFADNGLEVPTTYDEFLNVCETLKNNGVTPMTLAAPTAWIPSQFLQQVSVGIGGLDSYEGVVDGTLPWNNDSNIEAGHEIQKMIDNGYFQDGMLGMTAQEAMAQFQKGEAAMYYTGAWDITTLINREETPVADDIGTFYMPAMNSENNGIVIGTVDCSYAISESCPNKEAAVAFLKYLTSPESQQKLAYEDGRLPSTKVELDETKLDPLVLDLMDLSMNATGMVPWWDRVFGAGEGVEFNNKAMAIFCGDDVEESFNDLQAYAEVNAGR